MILIIYDKFRFEPSTSLAFEWFIKHCLRTADGIPLTDYQFRVHTDASAFPSDVTKVLLLGQQSLRIWANKDNIHQARGYPLMLVHNHVSYMAIATYHPQEAFDWKMQEDPLEEDSADDKDIGRTHPSNWRFWIKVDTEKLIKPRMFLTLKKEETRIYPPMHEAIRALRDNDILFLDIETRRGDQSVSCVGFKSGYGGPVYVVPFYRFNNEIAYNQLYICRFLKELSLRMCRSRVVIHNCFFDLFVLATKCRVLFGKDLYDTMVAHHRVFPEVEKSLSHAMSYWTWLPFHKDQGGTPFSSADDLKYWQYNAKDVYALYYIYVAQQMFLDLHSDYRVSVKQACASLYDYLLPCIQGIKVNELTLAETRRDVFRRIKQLQRVVNLMVGSELNPVSSKQCANYFHNKLQYRVVARSRETGAPSLDGESLYKLRIKYANPLIDVIIQCREKSKELSMLGFNDYETNVSQRI